MLHAIDPAPLAGGSRADVESVHAAERLRNTAPERPTQQPEAPPPWRSLGQVLTGILRRQHICRTPRLVLVELLEEHDRFPAPPLRLAAER
jgi:hypothetical protein